MYCHRPESVLKGQARTVPIVSPTHWLENDSDDKDGDKQLAEALSSSNGKNSECDAIISHNKRSSSDSVEGSRNTNNTVKGDFTATRIHPHLICPIECNDDDNSEESWANLSVHLPILMTYLLAIMKVRYGAVLPLLSVCLH